MIYGEEFVSLAFNKGLWLADSPDALPEGYCSEFENMIVDHEGHVGVRSDYVPVGTGYGDVSWYPGRPMSISPPPYLHDQVVKCWSMGGNAANTPTIIVSYDTSTEVKFQWVDGQMGDVYTQTLDTYANKPLALAQYNDRIYGVSINSSVYLYASWSKLAGSPVTSGLIQALPGAKFIMSFRDRMFACSDNKIYFTEVALPGGHPQNWNSGNNFLNLPMTDETPIIQTMIAHADRIYIFTDRGLFQLYASGASATWTIELITRAITIQNKHAATVVKDSLVFCDTAGVYIIEGAVATEIGQPVDRLFRDCNSFSVFPFEDGLILSASRHIDGGSYHVIDSTWTVFFDGVIWSRFEPQHSLPDRFSNTVAFSISNKVTGAANKTPKTFFVITHIKAGVKSYSIYYYNRNSNIGESGKNVYYRMTLKDFRGSNWWIVKRAKKLFISMYSGESSFEMSAIVDGEEYLLGQFANPVKTIVNPRREVYYNHAMPHLYRSLALTINGSIGYDNTRWVRPPVKFKEIALAMNTDTRSLPDKEAAV